MSDQTSVRTSFDELRNKLDIWEEILYKKYFVPTNIDSIRCFLFRKGLTKITTVLRQISNTKAEMAIKRYEYLDVKEKLQSSPQDVQLLEKSRALEEEISSSYQARLDEAIAVGKKYRFLYVY